MLIAPERFAEVPLLADDFSREDHRVIFRAIEEMAKERRAIDLVTLSEHLEAGNRLEAAGGLSYIATLMRDTPGASNVLAYASIVQQRSISRKASAIGTALTEESSDPQACDRAIKQLMELTTLRSSKAASVKSLLPGVLDMIDRRFRGLIKPGLTTGIKRLDKALGGLCPGRLYVVAARPAMGKTGFGMGMMLSNPSIPAGFLSMEQPNEQLVTRMLSWESGVGVHALRNGYIEEHDWPRLANASEWLARLQIEIDDSPAPTIDQITRQARKWKYEHDIQMLCGDYLQRIKGDGKNKRHEEVELFARTFKELARELDIPAVLLSQVSREVEKRQDRRPQMSDLKDSGAIEQEADVIMTLYREEVYNDEERYKGVAEIAIIKNRDGPLGRATCQFKAECVRFGDQHTDGATDPDMF